jgi:ketosteroid isomerase-like protein
VSTAVLKGARNPQDSTRVFADLLNRGDIGGAAYCFTKDACLLTPDATAIRGREEIRPILHQMIVGESRIEVQESSVVMAGEVALGTERWRIASAGSEGEPFRRELTPTIVLRQLEDVWKIAVAMPWVRR